MIQKEKNLDKNKIKKKIKEIKFFEKHYLAKIDLILRNLKSQKQNLKMIRFDFSKTNCI